MVLYRNWRYEQELDSLLWKIDFKDIEVHDENSPISGSTMPTSGSSEKNDNNGSGPTVNPPNIIVSSHGPSNTASGTSSSGKMTRVCMFTYILLYSDFDFKSF